MSPTAPLGGLGISSAVLLSPFVIGPNRSEFTEQIGRAPIVKMSRTMPPTPVAAP